MMLGSCSLVLLSHEARPSRMRGGLGGFYLCPPFSRSVSWFDGGGVSRLRERSCPLIVVGLILRYAALSFAPELFPIVSARPLRGDVHQAESRLSLLQVLP